MTTATVLVADDSLVIRAVVRDGLESEGYRVVEAVDGVDAVRQWFVRRLVCVRPPPACWPSWRTTRLRRHEYAVRTRRRPGRR